MSPEQVRSAKHVDSRTDIWSLGIILYELLAGRTPFEGSTTAAAVAICIDSPPPLSNFRSDVPLPLEQAILTALQKESGARYPNVKALAEAIAPFGTGAVQPPQVAFTVPPPAYSADSLPRVPMDSARTLPDHSSPQKASSVTVPSWTTRSTTTKRTQWVVIAVLAGATAIGLVAIGTHLTKPQSTGRSDLPETPSATTPPAQSVVPQLPSMATVEPVPSTIVSAKPQPPQPVRPRPTATVTAPTVHTAAPAPTRL